MPVTPVVVATLLYAALFPQLNIDRFDAQHSATHARQHFVPMNRSSDIVFNIDNVIAGEMRDLPFSVRNDSTIDWTVGTVHTGCSCTGCTIVRHEVPIAAQLDGVLSFRVPTVDGIFDRSARIELGASAGWIRIVARGEVLCPMVATPSRVDCVVPSTGRISPVEIAIHCRSILANDVYVLRAPEWCTVSCDPVSPQRCNVLLDVSPRFGQPAAYSKGEVILRAGSDNERLLIPVSITHSPGLSASPSQCFFGTVSVGSRTTERVVITKNASNSIPDTELISGYPSVTVQFPHDTNEPVTAEVRRVTANAYLVTVVFAPERSGPIRGSIRVHSDGIDSAIDIPLFGIASLTDEKSVSNQ